MGFRVQTSDGVHKCGHGHRELKKASECVKELRKEHPTEWGGKAATIVGYADDYGIRREVPPETAGV